MSSPTLRLHDLAGRDVIARLESQKVGTVSDILFSPHDGRIGAVLVESMGGLGGLVRQRSAVPGDAVLAVGPDAVIIRDRASVIEDVGHVDRAGLVSALEVKGRSVVTDEGVRVGKVHDFQMDVDDGRVTSYLVSPEPQRGPLDLGLGGGEERYKREFSVPVRRDVTVGADLITVPAALLSERRKAEGGSGSMKD